MFKLLGSLIVNTLALLIVAYLVPGFEVIDIKAAIVAAVVIGIINIFIKPILQIITLPITFMTLGLFAIALNVALLMGAAYVVPGFEIHGLLAAFIGSIALSIVSSFLNMLTK